MHPLFHSKKDDVFSEWIGLKYLYRKFYPVPTMEINLLQCIGNLQTAIQDIIRQNDELDKERQTLDTELNNLYHALELLNPDAVQLVQIASKMRKVLIARRLCKEKISQIQSVLCALDKAGNLRKDTFYTEMVERGNQRIKKYIVEATQSIQKGEM